MKNEQINHTAKFRKLLFLLEVFKLACTAFGGPQIHFTQFKRNLVERRKYLNLDELVELNSLCSILPGPTSTQMITAIGFKKGGPRLAFLTLAIWISPACFLMGSFALLVTHLGISVQELHFLKYIQPMASGFIIYGAFQFVQLFIHKFYHWIILVATTIIGILASTPYLFPILLIAGGLTSSLIHQKKQIHPVQAIKAINWSNLILFFAIFTTAALLGLATQDKLFRLFENMYRYGSLVFGGGNVLIPMMYNQFVVFKGYLNANDFLAGLGVLQAIPGPVFSFASYVGALAMSTEGLNVQILGSIIASIGIFLPGILLIFFVYPIWDQLKVYAPIGNAIEGINAVSTGLVITSAYLLFIPLAINQSNMIVLLITLFVLLTTKIPSPIIVIITLLAGFLV